MSFNMEIHNQGFCQFSIFESEFFRPMEKDLDLENIHLLVRVHTIARFKGGKTKQGYQRMV